ncbi:MAG: DUF1851 domain-containing protein [bacterium]
MEKILEYFKNNKVLNGYFRYVEPEELKENIDPEMYEIEGEFTPFAISVFGEVLFIEDNEYVSVINYAMDKCDTASHIDTFLEQLEDKDFVFDWFILDLYEEAKVKHGEVNETQIYGFVPFVFLGGSVDVNSLDKCDWKVHLYLIHQYLSQ